MKARYVREQKTICGKEYMEVDLLNVTASEHRASVRAKKQFASSLAMKRCNDRNALRKLRWKVSENFTERKKKTWLVHLTYSEDFLPEYDEDAQKALTNYIERLNRRQRQKYKEAMAKDHHNHGGVLRKVKYIAVTEFQHADEEKGLKEVRYHHHMILECDLSIDEIKDLWVTRCGKGWVEPLGLVKADRAEFDKGGLDAYCEYITKYEGKRTHKWRQSKGLRMPTQPRPNDTRHTPRKLAEAATLYIDDKKFWEDRYGVLKLGHGEVRQYAFVGAEPRFNEVTAEWHVIARFWADPRRQETKKAVRRWE